MAINVMKDCAMVGVLGLEPRSLAALDFESSVFTNFTIPPLSRLRLNEDFLHAENIVQMLTLVSEYLQISNKAVTYFVTRLSGS